MSSTSLFSVMPNYKPAIGVMGSASGYLMRNKKAVEAAREVGRQIAKNDCFLVNGACPGLPDEAARGCKEVGGETMGVSPAVSMCSHVGKYKSPTEFYDRFIFTGMGLMMRDIVNIRSSNAVIILPGGTGTLNEFTVAYDEGKPIGVLTGYDGCADHIEQILEFCHRDITNSMIMSSDPAELVAGLVKIMHEQEAACNIDDYLVGDKGVVTAIESSMDQDMSTMAEKEMA